MPALPRKRYGVLLREWQARPEKKVKNHDVVHLQKVTNLNEYRQDENLWGKLKIYEELLLRFLSQVDDDDQRSIQDALRLVWNPALKVRRLVLTFHSHHNLKIPGATTDWL